MSALRLFFGGPGPAFLQREPSIFRDYLIREIGRIMAVMLAVLVPSRRYFYRKSSILEERFTGGWILATTIVVVGTGALIVVGYGRSGIGAPSHRTVPTASSPADARSAATAWRNGNPFRAVPQPTLTVAPCGKTQP